MNKTNTCRGTFHSRPPVPMRLLFKRRSNFKEPAQALAHHLPEHDSLASMRDFIKARVHTEQWPRGRQVTPGRSTTYSMARSQTENSLSFPSATPNKEQQSDINLSLNQEPEESPSKATNLRQIEEKLDEVLQGRLLECLKFSGRLDWALAPQIDTMIAQVRKARQLNDPDFISEDLVELEKRIKLIEKLLAENMTESEIAKKYYLARVSHAQTAEGHKRHRTEPIVAEVIDRKREAQRPRQTVVRQSISHKVHSKPSNSAYKLDKLEVKYVDLGKARQPLPRSNYKRQFLHYSPVKNIASRPSDQPLPQSSSAKLCQSSYQSQFVPKRSQRFNHKELDACRDKIRDLPIIFGRRQKEEITKNMVGFFKARKEDQSKQQRQSHSLTSSTLRPTSKGQYARYFQSENRRAYGGQTGMAPTIKHKQMQKLKMHYRSKAHV